MFKGGVGNHMCRQLLLHDVVQVILPLLRCEAPWEGADPSARLRNRRPLAPREIVRRRSTARRRCGRAGAKSLKLLRD
eukprot:3723133-Pyramimonas_sp.AAC.1